MELRLLHRNTGQLILCAAMADDIVGWVLLSVVSVMATTGVQGGDIALSIGSVVLIVAVALLSRRFVRTGLEKVSKARDSGTAVTAVTAVVILILAGAALSQTMHLEAVFGAFLFGIVISSCGTLDAERIAPLRTTVMAVLAPLFFATAALRMDLTALADPAVLLVGLGVLAVAILGKFIGAYVGARLSRLGHWEALAIGAGPNARGVIEVIIAMVGLRLGVLSGEMYTIIVLVALVTSVMAPPVLRRTMAKVEQTDEETMRATMQDLDGDASRNKAT